MMGNDGHVILSKTETNNHANIDEQTTVFLSEMFRVKFDVEARVKLVVPSG